MLVLIDIFSRFLFIVPLKNKQHQNVTDGLKSVFHSGRKPDTLRTDKGSEFKNRWVKTFLKKEGVYTIYTQNETKANYAERVIRTIKKYDVSLFPQEQNLSLCRCFTRFSITRDLTDL